MSQQKLLDQVITFFQSQSVPYMLTGGLASSLLGRPRYTQDIDMVVDMMVANLQPLLDVFPEPWVTPYEKLSYLDCVKYVNVSYPAGLSTDFAWH